MNGREVLFGVSGGIAAYKAAAVVSQLVQAGLGVTVAMTPNAREFIGPATFAALSGRSVATGLFEPHWPLGAHIELAEQADLFCIAPATASFLAKSAHGMADDLLSTLYLCFEGPTLMAPAMNCEMWEKKAVQRNVTQLQNDGVQMIGPDEGWLSCRRRGFGRMSAPETIAAAIQTTLATLD